MVAGAGAGGSRVAIGTPVPGESSSSAGGVSIVQRMPQRDGGGGGMSEPPGLKRWLAAAVPA